MVQRQEPTEQEAREVLRLLGFEFELPTEPPTGPADRRRSRAGSGEAAPDGQ